MCLSSHPHPFLLFLFIAVEHLERRVALRVQMQQPFQYCAGHNVLSTAPLSFGERMERMVDLPGLAVEPDPEKSIYENNNAAGTAEGSPPLRYRPWRRDDRSAATAPAAGTSFLQDDVVIYHRDWFRASNWHNRWVARPRYMIGRYMNEVSGVHARVVQQCNELDEVWVPSHHHVGIFAAAGVAKEKLVVVPESIDPLVFDPEATDPMMLPG